MECSRQKLEPASHTRLCILPRRVLSEGNQIAQPAEAEFVPERFLDCGVGKDDPPTIFDEDDVITVERICHPIRDRPARKIEIPHRNGETLNVGTGANELSTGHMNDAKVVVIVRGIARGSSPTPPAKSAFGHCGSLSICECRSGA